MRHQLRGGYHHMRYGHRTGQGEVRLSAREISKVIPASELKKITTGEDLENMASSLHIPLLFTGLRNLLPKQPRTGGYILNLQPTDKGSGTHWTAIYLSKFPKHAFYFDSSWSSRRIEILSNVGVPISRYSLYCKSIKPCNWTTSCVQRSSEQSTILIF